MSIFEELRKQDKILCLNKQIAKLNYLNDRTKFDYSNIILRLKNKRNELRGLKNEI